MVLLNLLIFKNEVKPDYIILISEKCHLDINLLQYRCEQEGGAV